MPSSPSKRAITSPSQTATTYAINERALLTIPDRDRIGSDTITERDHGPIDYRACTQYSYFRGVAEAVNKYRAAQKAKVLESTNPQETE